MNTEITFPDSMTLPADTLVQAAMTSTVDTTVDTLGSWWDQPLVQEWLISKPIHIVIIVIVAIALNYFLRKLITKVSENAAASDKRSKIGFGVAHNDPVEEEEDPKKAELLRQQLAAQDKARAQRREARMMTLATVGRSAVSIVVWVWAALAILDEVGVNVTPLIASAGVVGVALGFGAQALVKDFLSGIFMMIEDQYGVGDTISVGDVAGDVEDVSLRVTTVRDVDGVLWFVRNGEILSVGNYSQGYSIARIEIPVSLSADVDAAQKTIFDTVQRSAAAEEYRADILGDPELAGISKFNVDHMVVRVNIKVMPAQKWAVERAMTAEIMKAMNAADIHAPYRFGYGFGAPGAPAGLE
ncbi:MULTISPECIES: mechanosensitive ion channel family protein [Corynebacterium]|uniref:mechanosensitive ion channel family protein n=1 Tax=Corynebacterium TaxID=1716 RepID=UPI001CEF6AF7|nr:MULTISPECIES: mechanosensitive ion channel family protein [Corynebacterium]